MRADERGFVKFVEIKFIFHRRGQTAEFRGQRIGGSVVVERIGKDQTDGYSTEAASHREKIFKRLNCLLNHGKRLVIRSELRTVVVRDARSEEHTSELQSLRHLV